MQLPSVLTKNMIALYGERGQAWLDKLPLQAAQYESQWSFSAQTCFPEANFNYVAPVTLQNGEEAVIKLAYPNKEFMTEIQALKHFNGRGSAKLLVEDAKRGAILLERIIPGTLLEHRMNVENTTLIAVELQQKLHSIELPSFKFPTLHDWFKGFDLLYGQFQGDTGPFPQHLVNSAHNISQELLASMQTPVLLHGDLHYANILYSAERGWLAIDPKGILGEPEFEIPLPRLSAIKNKSDLKYLVECFIETSGFEVQRIWHWLFSKAMLAAWCSFQDQKQIEPSFLWLAESTYALLSL